MAKTENTFIVNPGSTSTKVAIANGGNILCRETFQHRTEKLKKLTSVWEQFPFRLDCCKQWASRHVTDCAVVISLGGLLRSVPGGVYRVTQAMLNDARSNIQGEHASNLGCALADELAKAYNAGAYIADPVSVDEFEPLAYYSGHPKIKRRSLSHALSIHAAAQQAACDLGLDVRESSFIIGHLGGGISIAAVRNGKIIDVNDASSDGPFSPERTGGLPLQQLISLFYTQKYCEKEFRKLVMGNGGLVAYLGTNSVIEVEKRVNMGDPDAKEVFQAMAYQIAKEIGAMATTLKGSLNAIVLTGGAAASKLLCAWVEERAKFIAPIIVYPGDDEMRALASAADRVINGLEQVKEY